MSLTAAAPLSAELRARTSGAHTGAETAPLFARLSAGAVSRDEVAGLLGRLLPVYEALESAAGLWVDDPVVAPLLLPGLERAPRLRADLAALGTGPVLSPAAAAYAGRVAQAATAGRPAFIAHHYTRYLGDLSGGQVIRAALGRTLGLDAATGASFFVFDGLRPGPVKQAYRSVLDTLPFSTAERDALVAEVLVAYRLNTDIARELTPGETA